MLVRDVMQPPAFVQAEDSLAVAARKLQHDNIGCLPVCQGERVIGMLTDRDIAMRVADGRNASQMTVMEAISGDPLTCFEDDSVEQAAILMNQGHVLRLAVLDRKTQRLTGVISVSDLGGIHTDPRHYEVTFFKKMSDHYGHSQHAEVMRITIVHGSKDEAIAAAMRQFEQAKQVNSWSQLADGYDVTTIHHDEHGVVDEHELTSEREARIKRRAYELWEQAGAPAGQDKEYWNRAAAEIDHQDRSEE